MNLNFFIDRLSKNREVFAGLVGNISLEQARWKPSTDKWSMLEVVNHLYDEEREDFRQRVELTLGDPTLAWPPIDPRAWVGIRRYNERKMESSLNYLWRNEKFGRHPIKILPRRFVMRIGLLEGILAKI